ncbi:MAG: cytoskeleton protein RodZ [Marinobacter maritimus]|jgi:cytoskeleton protein RodZ|nr:helix-turn-helix domain-containing protein [Oceanospirillales bacterium]
MTSDESQPTVLTETVGQQLKKAREKNGLSVSEIADAQHLRNGIIQAIENGDYGQIDSELFLKGYVRAYARQVGLSGDAIIADLNRELEPARQQKAAELEANPLIDIERRRRRKRRMGKLLLLVVVVVLIGALVVTFVLPKFSSGEAGVALTTMSEPEHTASEADSTAAADDLSGLSGDRSETETVADGSAGDFSGDNTATAAAEPAVGGQLSDEELAASDPEPVLTDDIAEDRIPVVTQSTEPALADPSIRENASVSGTLEIDFTGDCWVQVRDATGNQLASSLKRAGERLEVSGEAPLKVVIGAVDTVATILFRGEPVDIGDYPVVNNRSEFTLTI